MSLKTARAVSVASDWTVKSLSPMRSITSLIWSVCSSKVEKHSHRERERERERERGKGAKGYLLFGVFGDCLSSRCHLDFAGLDVQRTCQRPSSFVLRDLHFFLSEGKKKRTPKPTGNFLGSFCCRCCCCSFSSFSFSNSSLAFSRSSSFSRAAGASERL